jgi:hypothetical protein
MKWNEFESNEGYSKRLGDEDTGPILGLKMAIQTQPIWNVEVNINLDVIVVSFDLIS